MSKNTDEVNRVLEVLNEARAMELQGIFQYMHHHYELDDADYAKLAKEMKQIAVDEMKHAEAFAERMKDIDSSSEPTATPRSGIVKGEKVDKMYDTDKKSEEETIRKYNDFAQICRDNKDVVSATLFERITNEEQEHFNYFEDTADHVKQLGNSFLAKQTGKE
jgi:bacterioferritin